MTTIAVPTDTRHWRSGLGQAVRAEWTKLATLRSTKWALLDRLARHRLGQLPLHPRCRSATSRCSSTQRGLRPDERVVGGFALGSLVIGILGVLAMTGEYGSGTIRSSLAAVPRRTVFFARQGDRFGVVALVVGLVLSFLSFFVGQAVLRRWRAHRHARRPRCPAALLESSVFLALLALFGVGIGAIIRHSAGAIATFVGCTLLLPLLLHNVAGNPSRFMPVMLLGNSVAAVVPVYGALSGTTGFLLMALYAAVALAVGAVLLERRDA